MDNQKNYGIKDYRREVYRENKVDEEIKYEKMGMRLMFNKSDIVLRGVDQ